MKRTALQLLVVAALAPIAPAGAEEIERPVPLNLDGVPLHWHARIEAKAKEGITSLRRYLEQAQHIHGVRLEAIVRWDELAAMEKATRDAAKLADVGKKEAK